jgi:hypothetical protein
MGIAALISSLANLLTAMRTMMAPRPEVLRNNDGQTG